MASLARLNSSGFVIVFVVLNTAGVSEMEVVPPAMGLPESSRTAGQVSFTSTAVNLGSLE
jgi:hypothetical protein